MNVPLMIIFIWIAAALEWGLRDALQFGERDIAPSALLLLAAFVALWAQPAPALFVAGVIGFIRDLLYQAPLEVGGFVVVVGPHTLGALIAAYAIMNVRALMLKRSLLALPILCLGCHAIAATFAIALIALRAAYDVLAFDGAGSSLLDGYASAVATALLAVVAGPVLGLARPVIGSNPDVPLVRRS